MYGKAAKGLHIFAAGFTIFILAVFLSICFRVFTRQILVKHMGITNSFTDIVLFDAEDLKKVPKVGNDTKPNIDWQKLYPFLNSESADEEKSVSRLTQLKTSIDSIERKIMSYTTKYLPFYRNVTELAGKYEQLVLWNFSSFGEYNNVMVRNGGYLVGIEEKKDISEAAGATIDLADFCKSEDAEFMYIEYPNKICIYEDADICGTMDFSNQNADKFLKELNNNGVLTYDLRAVLHEENLNHHSLFFKTDHHWKPQAGLWASQHILDFLNKAFDYSLDTEILDSDSYYEKVYKNWFLGSQGKKVTLSVCNPEDISLIYPKFRTLIHYEIPNLSINEYGSFDITYDMKHIKEMNYYNKNPYAAYNHADQPLIRLENELMDKGPQVLIIHNSFSNCVIPFLAMGIKNVDAIDLRWFTGSLRSYISQEKPDAVIIAYQSVPGSIDYSRHNDLFDFR